MFGAYFGIVAHVRTTGCECACVALPIQVAAHALRRSLRKFLALSASAFDVTHFSSGLAVAWVLGVPKVNVKEKASYISDLFSLLGTAVLWVYWPSFVAGATPAGTSDAELQLVQTILSLAAATVTTFALSAYLSEDGKLRAVDIQNATLAGGVTIGILAGTPLTAAGAMLVGSLAGALSTFGFVSAR